MTMLEAAVGMVAQLIPILCYGVTGYVTGRFWAMSQFRKRLHKIAANRRSANERRRRENEDLTERNESLNGELRTVTIELQRALTPQPVDIGRAVQDAIAMRRRERRRERARARAESSQFRRLDL